MYKRQQYIINKRKPKPSQIKRIANALEVSEDIFHDTGKQCWIPIEVKFPNHEQVVLISAQNRPDTMIATYREDTEGCLLSTSGVYKRQLTCYANIVQLFIRSLSFQSTGKPRVESNSSGDNTFFLEDKFFMAISTSLTNLRNSFFARVSFKQIITANKSLFPHIYSPLRFRSIPVSYTHLVTELMI